MINYSCALLNQKQCKISLCNNVWGPNSCNKKSIQFKGKWCPISCSSSIVYVCCTPHNFLLLLVTFYDYTAALQEKWNDLVYIFHVHVCYGYLIKLYATFSGQLSDGIANARISSYENVATTINEVSNCGNFDCTTKILNDREYTYNQLTSNALSDFNYLYITINNSGGPTILLPTNFEFSW